MKLLAAATAGQLRKDSPGQKTRMTANSWQVTSVGETTATVTGSIVNLWLDSGTGLYGPLRHLITPKAAKALAFHRGTFGPGGNLRLSGSPRAGKAGASAQLVVVRSVKGMKPRPFIKRALQSVTSKAGTDVIVKVWNDAA